MVLLKHCINHHALESSAGRVNYFKLALCVGNVLGVKSSLFDVA